MLIKYNVNQTTLKILALYRSNYRASFHLREIARKIEVDVKAVQLQLKRLEKMNAFLSSIRGKNKEYRLNLANIIALYQMVLAEAFTSINFLNNNFEIKKLVGESYENLGEAALLFGSYAKGEATKESDIDILIIAYKEPEFDVFREVSRLIGREISVRFATREQFSRGLARGDPLIMETLDSHIILKGTDNICNILWSHHERR